MRDSAGRRLASAKSLAKSLAESLTKSLAETLFETLGETFGETFRARQASSRIGLYCMALRKTLSETRFSAGSSV